MMAANGPLKKQRTMPHKSMLTGLQGTFGTVLADPPWRFQNRTGKMAPEHKRLRRYRTMSIDEICAMPVAKHAAERCHLYLWVPNALVPWGLQVMDAWGFQYKTNLVWFKVRKDGGPDGRGVGFYFRNVTELVLFGVRGQLRTLPPGRRQVNLLSTRKEEHSKKPDELYRIIEQCSPGPRLELFARERVAGWTQWGDELGTYLGRRPVIPRYNAHKINGADDSSDPADDVHTHRRRSRSRAS
ncbi:MAG TPA: MT-A70 family methyltransferase [Pirellulales bacterium]|nr:MT-A70 family methyltransferase [Pirellulales bacterium]